MVFYVAEIPGMEKDCLNQEAHPNTKAVLLFIQMDDQNFGMNPATTAKIIREQQMIMQVI